ncbi:MAG: LysM peptidoglycan-binding domain-containing protein [Anaerolineae bacterium]|nr:LysM peptidoglycan-binding domain-containing protein [Anaerolineae bacterium]
MSPENTSSTKVCPNCGTRANASATRCLVCGRSFSGTPAASTNKAIQNPRVPEITLSLPIALGLMTVIMLISAAVVLVVVRSTPIGTTVVTPTVTQTTTPTFENSPTPTETLTPMPTFTPLPPIEYSVKSNDTCLSIAYGFDVSPQSIVLLNNLAADCGVLSIGQKLLIPQPTPTASPMPTSTLSAAQATEEACDKLQYRVTSNDTLSGISANYNIDIEVIKQYNGKTTDTVFEGETIILPLCQRRPTAGPTPTPTLPPPYTAPSLLLPADGAVYTANNESVTLQWASVGTLRDNEAYAVTVEDLTEGTGRKITEYTTNTKYNVPVSFRPVSDSPHILSWHVQPVRQNGQDKEGKPVWDSAGAVSAGRVFNWWGSTQAQPVINTTPQPSATVTPGS